MIVFIVATDRARTRTFYEGVLGLRVIADQPSALVMDAGGRMLRVSFLAGHIPPPYTVLGWQVQDVEAAVDELAAKSVKFEPFDGFKQDERGIFTFPNGDRVAWFRDPAGNMLSLTEFGASRAAVPKADPARPNG